MTKNKSFTAPTNGANDNSTSQRRRFPRRDQDVCMIKVDGHAYPVIDWSQCGVLFEADTRVFDEGQIVNMILRFKVGNGIEDVKVTGEIVRKNSRAIATTFTDMHEPTLDKFNQVLDKLEAA